MHGIDVCDPPSLIALKRVMSFATPPPPPIALKLGTCSVEQRKNKKCQEGGFSKKRDILLENQETSDVGMLNCVLIDYLREVFVFA